jgi:hypothetical protein
MVGILVQELQMSTLCSLQHPEFAVKVLHFPKLRTLLLQVSNSTVCFKLVVMTPPTNSGRPGFYYRPGNRLTWLNRFHSLPQYLQATSGIVPWNIARPLPYTWASINHSHSAFNLNLKHRLQTYLKKSSQMTNMENVQFSKQNCNMTRKVQKEIHQNFT